MTTRAPTEDFDEDDRRRRRSRAGTSGAIYVSATKSNTRRPTAIRLPRSGSVGTPGRRPHASLGWAVMKKLLILAILVGLGAFAAQKLRSS